MKETQALPKYLPLMVALDAQSLASVQTPKPFFQARDALILL
jgi:hypothetical protein